jgi:hypothetical protein
MEDLKTLFKDKSVFDTLTELLEQNGQLFGYFRNSEGDLFYEERVNRKQEIKYLMHAQSGSLILLYNRTNCDDWDDAVIVSADSSGEPTAIVAKNLGDYLRLIHEGDGLIQKVLTVGYMYKLIPQTYKTPVEKITQEDVDSIIQFTEANEPNFQRIKDVLNKNGFQQMDNPVAYIWDAFNTDYPVAL